MAGLLAAELLRREQPVIAEAQPSLPDNHGALLRFRSDIVGRETRQPFREVLVHKAVKGRGGVLRNVATIQDANMYSIKVTGGVADRSILNLDPVTRYIAPDDFIARLANGHLILTSTPFEKEMLERLRGERQLVTISTMPMPSLMAMVGWTHHPDAFRYRSIWSVTCELTALPVDVFQTIYYPDPELPYYRASITGNRLIIEIMADTVELPRPDISCIRDVLEDFGFPLHWREVADVRTKHQKYGKLISADAKERHEFITAMTDEYNIYSVGRFATWRQILLDDVVKDIKTVHRMLSERSAYRRRLSHIGQ